MPTVVGSLTGVVQLVAGASHTCALLDTGEVSCWGDNDRGQVGDGTTTRWLYMPTTVVGLTQVRDVGAGWSHTCAATTVGDLFCWGDNTYGQLGVPACGIGVDGMCRTAHRVDL
jgi:alpha-tubulin suppressor-like RCC1 family protein